MYLTEVYLVPEFSFLLSSQTNLSPKAREVKGLPFLPACSSRSIENEENKFRVGPG